MIILLLTDLCSLFTDFCSPFTDPCSLFTDLCSLFTDLCSLFTDLCLPVKCIGTRNDFEDFVGDGCLSGFVVSEGELIA